MSDRPLIEIFIDILNRHIPNYDEYSIEHDTEITATRILLALDAAGWLTTPERVAEIQAQWSEAYGK